MNKCLRRLPKSFPAPRSFSINTSEQDIADKNRIFPTNFVRTSKYTIIDYLPKSLLFQFKRYANVFFLLGAILQSIPSISPLHPFTAIAPLAIVLALSMLREGYEDYGRHKSDWELNNMTTIALFGGELQSNKKWAHIMVGDILLVKEDEPFPADLILLGSSYDNGQAFVQTGSLDGEKNLKLKNSIKETNKHFSEKEIPLKDELKTYRFSAQEPDSSLYSFEGSYQIGKNGKKFLEPKQLLLRGSYLKNTPWVVGVVVYTGNDTKIMKNSESSKNKISEIERKTNTLILYILSLLAICCAVCGLGNFIWSNYYLENHQYLYQSSNMLYDSFLVFWTYFLLLNTMLPISLIVSLEFVKIFQSYMISADEDMYVAEKDRYVKVITSSINEELGQIEYLFSDKTGTLTCNEMEFKFALIGNEFFGEAKENKGENEIKIDKRDQMKRAKSKNGISSTFKDDRLMNILHNGSFDGKNEKRITTKDYDDIIGEVKWPHKVPYYAEFFDLAVDYWTLMALCHECLVHKDEEGDIYYQGQSPDEISLVDAAKNVGFKYLGANNQQVIDLDVLGHHKKVQLMNSFEFNSARKRMSVIVKNGNKYKLYVKGADNIILARLNENIDQPFQKTILFKLDDLAKLGLRTLCMAVRDISEEEYEDISAKIADLADAANRDEKMAQLAEKIEKNLFLIGATAIEDRLQTRVPETIRDMISANIKVWMLTGDKLETAENIARSCKLLQADMTLLVLAEKDDERLEEKFVEVKGVFDLCLKEKRKKCLLVEGETLAMILNRPELKALFISISQYCDSVICCRVTPKQKAEVVRAIKNSMNKITAAIGDGANDVNMILEAHIGIGIYGNEGMRAVQASDFAVGEFQCIWRLFLVHGRWSYIRISEMILYFFYKNMLFTVPQFYFAFLCSFTGQTVFDDWYISLYNLIFTALPLIIRAIFEQDVNYKVLIKKKLPNLKDYIVEDSHLKNQFPKIYATGQMKTIFNSYNFFSWVAQGIFHGGIYFLIFSLIFMLCSLNSSGINSDIWGFSITFFSAIITLADLKLALYTKYWTWINYLAWGFLSLAIYYAWVFISDGISTLQVYKTPVLMGGTALFWLGIFFASGFIFIFDLLIFVIKTELKKGSVSDIKKKMIKIRENKYESNISVAEGIKPPPVNNASKTVKSLDINGRTLKSGGSKPSSALREEEEEKEKII